MLLAKAEVRSLSVACVAAPTMLKHSQRGGVVSFNLLSRGSWADLMHEAQSSLNQRRASPPAEANSHQRRAEAACRKAQLGEVSCARQCLTEAALALGTDETFTGMQSTAAGGASEDPRLRRSASPRPGGSTYEHLNFVSDDPDRFDLLFGAVTSLAQASITAALMGARLTALAKLDESVRGIATGSSLRRLVAWTLAKQFASDFEDECAPFQYALPTPPC